MIQARFILAGLVAAAAIHAYGQTSSTSVTGDSGAGNQESLKTGDLKKEQTNAPGSDEADQLITNRAMRAQTGSLSTWSFKSTWNYNGGSIESPLAASRPNIQASATNGPALAYMTGQVGIKYRVSTDDSFLLQLGLDSYAPFNSGPGSSDPSLVKSYNAQHGNIEAYDPTLSYIHLFKVAGIQNFLEFDGNPVTRNGLVQQGYTYYLTVYDTAMYEIGTSGLSVGGTVQVSASGVRNDGGALVTPGNPADGNLGQGEDTYDWQLYPTVEYVINDHFNLRTLTQLQYQHIRDMTGTFNFKRARVAQSFGVGISITRDIFLYPNIQFIPDDITPKQTNVGLQANLNIF
jgi:hypothetical protein